MLVVLAVTYLFTGNSGHAQALQRPTSFAISGGASKGAYEAGLTWATVEIIRRSAAADDSPYGGRAREIVPASFAGTSAGGINILLAGLAWCVRAENEGGFPNRIDDNIFRDSWLTPDINNLLPPEPTAPPYLPDDAALSRQALVTSAHELQAAWRQPDTFVDDCRIPLGVTVTRTVPSTLLVGELEVVNQLFHIPFELYVRDDGSAGFMFDPSEYPRLRDATLILMPWSDGDPEYSVSDDQIIDAVFTTSAFPTGFGRRRLAYCRLSEFIADNAPSAMRDPGDLRCPADYELAEAEFADGGLFDNLPLGFARKLAENRGRPTGVAVPTIYLYLDPSRYRYDTRQTAEETACDSEAPPAACRTIEYSFSSETRVLQGFLGTARKFALYNELSDEAWQSSLPALSTRLAEILRTNESVLACQSLQRLFTAEISCAEALIRTSHFIERVYRFSSVPITDPNSAERLTEAGIASDCRVPSASQSSSISAECSIDISAVRRALADALTEIATSAGPDGSDLLDAIGRSAESPEADRSMAITSVGAPVTGQLLGAFGAFLERKFRVYDYYVGVYDAVFLISHNHCGPLFDPDLSPADYSECAELTAERFYRMLDVPNDPTGRYMFALISQSQFDGEGNMPFAQEPMPPEVHDMRIIHEALNLILPATADEARTTGDEVFVERDFFAHLGDNGFSPTLPPEGGEPLLAEIIEDPENWEYELTKRWTTRLVYLEQQAEEVFEAREPDPDKRETAQTELLGAAAWSLQSVTYRYPNFAFAPSTAPESWVWRNFIPYEVGFDIVEGDLSFSWQPTWSVGARTNLGLRFGLGFAGGILDSTDSVDRENYGILGFDVTYLRESTFMSSFGFAPAVYHSWSDPRLVDQTTFGFDGHAGLLNNRLRIGLGARDASNVSDTWFLTLSVDDLPGMLYWLTR